MSRFDKVYTSIKKRISLIVEDFSIDKSTFSDYEFKTDDENNIICTFSIKDENEEFVVLGKYYNEEISFVLTDNSGSSVNYTEKEFATNYNKYYEGFKEALNNYLEDDKATDNELGKIDSFNDEMNDQINKDPDIKVQRSYEVDGTKFLFKLLNDIAVENYCECVFDFQDKKTDEVIFVRSLLNIMKKNSIIIKLIFFNDNGELIDKVTRTDFLRNYPEVYKKLENAINKFEDFVEEMK
jgi:hypothetical protein